MKITPLMPRLLPETDRRALSSALLLAAAGGFLNGLIGTGAGILFLYAAGLLGVTKEDPRAKYAFSLACVLPVSVLSLALHPTASLADSETLRRMLLPAVIGGGAGAILRERIRAVWLNRAFALLTALSGVFLILR